MVCAHVYWCNFWTLISKVSSMYAYYQLFLVLFCLCWIIRLKYMYYVLVPCVSKINIKNPECFLHFGSAMHFNFPSNLRIVKWFFRTNFVIEMLKTHPDLCRHILHFTAAPHFNKFWHFVSFVYFITSCSQQNITLLEWHLAVKVVDWLCWKKGCLRF